MTLWLQGPNLHRLHSAPFTWASEGPGPQSWRHCLSAVRLWAGHTSLISIFYPEKMRSNSCRSTMYSSAYECLFPRNSLQGNPITLSYWFLNLSLHQYYLEGSLVRTRIAGSTPEFPTQEAWEGPHEFTCLTGSRRHPCCWSQVHTLRTTALQRSLTYKHNLPVKHL